MMGLVEGLYYAKKANLDQTKIIDLLSGGAAGSWSLSNYGPRIVNVCCIIVKGSSLLFI